MTEDPRPSIRIRVGPLAFTATWEDRAAPRTCAAFRRLLPYRQRIIQARWSGEAGWIPLGDFDIGISRDPEELVTQTIGRHHQYPDGLMLFLGTMFAPVQDRDVPGQGFTHHPGDIVTIAAPGLGALVNSVGLATEAPEWRFGAAALMRNLAARGLLREDP